MICFTGIIALLLLAMASRLAILTRIIFLDLIFQALESGRGRGNNRVIQAGIITHSLEKVLFGVSLKTTAKQDLLKQCYMTELFERLSH